MIQQKTRAWLLAAALVLLAIVLTSCGPTTGPSIEFKPASTQRTEGTSDAQTVAPEPTASDEFASAFSHRANGTADAQAVAPTATPESRAEARALSLLGFVQKGEATEMENGGRVPLGEDKVVEVFISPYPPDWQTDLHIFILDKDTFEPITDTEVELDYEMVFMDHGIDTRIGTKVADGHYVLPISFLMYGDWLIDTTFQLPAGKKHLRFVVKFFP